MVKNFLYTHIADYVMADTTKGSAAFLICTCGTLKLPNYRQSKQLSSSGYFNKYSFINCVSK